MDTLIWSLIWVSGLGYLLYHRTNLQVFTAATGIGLILTTLAQPFSILTLLLSWVIYLGVFITLNITDIRKKYITKYLFNFASKATPKISDTEKTAIEAGHTWWEGELFRGKPEWDLLLNHPKATLSKEEKSFVDNQVETLCGMLNDWEITHKYADLTEEVWQYLKDEKFFGMIIPKKYGGLEFSAVAHSYVITKLAGQSISAATTVAVPNSLGPAELLLHYGTEDQKNYYLPKLANGQEIPCFALTGPEAGSDATSIPDIGTVCMGEYNGQKIMGIKLNFNKRYITLAPVATVVGLAFKLYDPENLLENNIKDYGITCALIPRETPGMEIGDRHFPLNTAFLNGPVVGKNVFIPLDFIIGGVKMAGQGWRMLMECLSAGRSITLPSVSSGGSNVCCLTTGAYSRIRKQFNTPICTFEGIQEALARIVGYNYISNAARLVTASVVDQNLKPAVLSAIVKYHITEYGRKLSLDAMDIHGGKGICLGPNNYLGRGYQQAPIAITVEGANILTRNMIIFGQGAIRCHPYALEEMHAIINNDLEQFDNLVYRHAGYLLSNAVRSFWLSLTTGRFSFSPKNDATKKYYQWLNKFSSNMAFLSDLVMALMGGKLKRKEGISARLGDILSNMYLMSTVLKHYVDKGSPADELVVLDWTCKHLAYETQKAITEVIHNYPYKFIGLVIKLFTQPLGKVHKMPSDKLNKELAKLVSQPSEYRNSLFEHVYHTDNENNFSTKTAKVLANTIEAEPIFVRLQKAIKQNQIEAVEFEHQLQEAIDKNILTDTECDKLRANRTEVLDIINVDQFKTEDLISLAGSKDINKISSNKTTAKNNAKKVANLDVLDKTK